MSKVVTADYIVLDNDRINVNLPDSRPFHIYLDSIEQRIYFPHDPNASMTVLTDIGNFDLAGDYNITGTITVPAPVSPGDAVPKSYIDDIVLGFDYKEAARVASGSNIPLVGPAPLVVDTVTLVTGDRILLFGQSIPAQNGVYSVTNSGPTYTLSRASDCVQGGLNCGTFIYVCSGSAGATSYVLDTPNPINVGVTGLNFTPYGGGSVGIYTAGNGLQLAGNQFSVATSVSTGSFIASSYVSTPVITAAGSQIDFDGKQIVDVSSLTAPVINPTGATAIGNNASAVDIYGSGVTIHANTAVQGNLRANNVIADNTIAIGTAQKITISPLTAITAPRDYYLPFSATNAATIPLVTGVGATARSVLMVESGHTGFWQEVTLPAGRIFNYVSNTLAPGQVAASITIADDTGVMISLRVLARAVSNLTAAFGYLIAAKNVSGTVTVPPPPQSGQFSGDPVFGGFNVSVVAGAGTVDVVVNPPVAPVVWKIFADIYE